MKLLAVLNPLAARLACCSSPFMACTYVLLRLSSMPRTTASAQRKGQGFKQGANAAALSCPRHVHLRRLAADLAGNARNLGVQPSLVLKEVQVPPLALESVVHALCPAAWEWGQGRQVALQVSSKSMRRPVARCRAQPSQRSTALASPVHW